MDLFLDPSRQGSATTSFQCSVSESIGVGFFSSSVFTWARKTAFFQQSAKKFCCFRSFHFSFPHFLKFAIVPYTADIVDIFLIFLICTLAILFIVYAFLAISLGGRMQDYLCTHFFALNSCCRIRSYSISSSRSLLPLRVRSTACK